MKHLQEYLDKKDNPYDIKIIRIGEKIDGSCFIIKVNNGGIPSYYQRGGTTKIDYLVRARNSIYEDLLNHFNKIDFSNYKNYEFHIEFFFDGMDCIVKEDRKFKNNMILNTAFKNCKMILTDYSDICDHLQISEPITLFYGVPTDELIDSIDSYLFDFEELSYILGVDRFLEGYVITDGQNTLKMVNPVFREMVHEKRADTRKSFQENRRPKNPAVEDFIRNVDFKVPEKIYPLLGGETYSQTFLYLILYILEHDLFYNTLAFCDGEDVIKINENKWYSLNTDLLDKRVEFIDNDTKKYVFFELLRYYSNKRKRTTQNVDIAFKNKINETIDRVEQYYK